MHLFTFYFGIVADITPPVALAAMAGAAIAGGDPLKTGVNASRLAIAAFIVPYVFVLNPSLLLLQSSFLQVVQIVVTSLVGILGISMCLERFWKSKLNLLQMLMALVGGLLLVYPETVTDIIGIVMVVAVVAWQELTPAKN